MAVIFFFSVSIPSLETICPKYAIHDLKNSHLLGLSLNPAADNFANTPLNLSMCSSGIFKKNYDVISIDYTPFEMHFPQA